VAVAIESASAEAAEKLEGDVTALSRVSGTCPLDDEDEDDEDEDEDEEEDEEEEEDAGA